MMILATRILLVLLIAMLLPACEKWAWPPYEKSLRELFAERQDQFDEVRINMLADGLELVDYSHVSGRALLCAGESCPATIGKDDEQLQEKYSDLIEERSIFRYTMYDSVFYVSGMPSPNTQGGEFFFDFVWSEKKPVIPHCEEEKARLPTCGTCYEELDPNWYVQWRWFPDDLGPEWDGRIGEGLPTPEEIEEQHEIALDECLEKGRQEMGLD